MIPKTGVVYILVNKSMPGLVKIGFTTDSAEVRAKDLSNHTGVPTPFAVAWSSERISDPQAVEQEVHRRLISLRTNRGREFFKIEVKKAIAIIEDLAGYEHQNALEHQRLLTIERERRALEERHQRAQRELKDRVIESHRRYIARKNFAESEKNASKDLLAFLVIAPIWFYLDSKIGLHWSIPLIVFGLHRYRLHQKKATLLPLDVAVTAEGICVRCFECEQKVFISSRFLLDNPNSKCSCPSCKTDLI